MLGNTEVISSKFRLDLPEPKLWLLILIMSFGSVGAVLFTPGLPMIAQDFGISSSLAQLTITIFLLGYGLGQLIYGPLANGYGRKGALKIGICLEIIGALLCVASGSLHVFWLLIVARFIMALGAAVGVTLTFTIIHDFYFPEQTRKILAYVSLAFAIMPGLSTTVGGFLTQYLSWESCFYFLAFYGVFLWWVLRYLAETAVVIDKHAIHPISIIKGYLKTFSNKNLIFCSLLIGANTSLYYVFSATAPFIGIQLIKLSPDVYGVLNIIPSIALACSGLGAAALSSYLNTKKTIFAGLGLFALGSVTMLLLFFGDVVTRWSLFLSVSIVYLGASLVFTNLTVLAMHQAENRSNAAAVMSFINIGGAFVAVTIFGLLRVSEVIMLPLFFCGIVTCMLLMFAWLQSRGDRLAAH